MSEPRKVVPFSHYQLFNIPEALRLLANKIEAGDTPCDFCVVALENNSDGDSVDYRAFGRDGTTLAHAVGVLEAAKLHMLFHKE